MKRYFGLVLALVALLGAVYLVAPYLRTSQNVVPVGEQKQVEATSTTVHEESDTYRVDMEYPQFGILPIDTDIKSKVDAAIAEFKGLPPNPPDSATPQNSFDGSFDSVYVGPDVVSVRLIFSQYTGGAHPMTILSGLNYDRAGRQLLQSDAFEMIGMTVEQVSAVATADLNAKLGAAMFEEGANTNPENFSSFIIFADTVTFIFQPYQVAPYAAGAQEVSFERKK